jgi:hypothetical protein
MNIDYNPMRLSDDSLLRLRDHCCCNVTALTFSNWLLNEIDQELMRRNCDASIEPGYPWLPENEWSNADVGAALQFVTALSYGLRTNDAGEFSDALVTAIVALAKHRLTKTS